MAKRGSAVQWQGPGRPRSAPQGWRPCRELRRDPGQFRPVASLPFFLSSSPGVASAPPGATLLPLVPADGANSNSSAIFASRTHFTCCNKSMKSLQGFKTSMAVSSPVEAAERICWPGRSQVFKSRASSSDTFNSWLSHHISRASRARSSCFIPLFLRKQAHTFRARFSCVELAAPMFPAASLLHKGGSRCTLCCPRHFFPARSLFSAHSALLPIVILYCPQFLCCPQISARSPLGCPQPNQLPAANFCCPPVSPQYHGRLLLSCQGWSPDIAMESETGMQHTHA